jgi:hypothetical protein
MPKPNGQKTDEKAIEAHERAVKAVRLRKAGLPYDEIAVECGFNSPQAAHKAVKSLLTKTAREAGDELRELQEQRLDEALFAIYDKVQNGSLLAVDRLVKIEQARASLYAQAKGKPGKPGDESGAPARAKVTIYIPANGRGEASEGEDGEEGGDAGGD